MSDTLYKIDFLFRGVAVSTWAETRLENIEDGFWVNDYRDFTPSQAAKYWIPPSQIVLVTKGGSAINVF